MVINNLRKKEYSTLFPQLFPLISGVLWGGVLAGFFSMHPRWTLLSILTGVLAAVAGCLAARRMICRKYQIVLWQAVLIADLFFRCPAGLLFFFFLLYSGGEPEMRRYNSGFICGLPAGGLLLAGTDFFSYGIAFCLLSVLQIWKFNRRIRQSDGEDGIPALPKRTGRFIAAFFVVVLTAISFLPFNFHRGTDSVPVNRDYHPAPVTRFCALGVSENSDAKILIIGENFPPPGSQLEEIFNFYAAFREAGQKNLGKFDVVMLEAVPDELRSTFGVIMSSVKRNGIIVLPEKLCRELPELQWTRLPGVPGREFAAARVDGEILKISNESIDHNLQKIFPPQDGSRLILPGALSGLLIDSRFEKLSLPPPETRHLRWLPLSVIFLLLMMDIRMRNSRWNDLPGGVLSGFAFALAGTFVVSRFAAFDRQWLIALLLTGMVLRIGVKPALQRILIFLPAVLLAWFCISPGRITALFAVLTLLLAFAVESWTFENGSAKRRPFFICGEVAGCAIGVLCLFLAPELRFTPLLIFAGIKIWFILRS